ncbi:MAG: 3D (Asp-Asp-Asp) domain-containing protein [Verrucomicrobia bacterium]|nr:MAG: 3D (Asp-Asp-Asp) domain-containing protein [Verrucomicrobiota bacterium]
MMSAGTFGRSKPSGNRAVPLPDIILRKLVRKAWLFFLFLGGCAEVEAERHAHGSNRIQVRSTAYTHTEAGGVNNAVGNRLRFGSDVSSAAADWSWLPVGTRFRVEETGRNYVVEDYGSGLVGKRTVDLYMPNASMMRLWGVRMINIEILEWGSRPISKMLLERRKGGETARKMLSAMGSEHEPGH